MTTLAAPTSSAPQQFSLEMQPNVEMIRNAANGINPTENGIPGNTLSTFYFLLFECNKSKLKISNV